MGPFGHIGTVSMQKRRREGPDAVHSDTRCALPPKGYAKIISPASLSISTMRARLSTWKPFSRKRSPPPW